MTTSKFENNESLTRTIPCAPPVRMWAGLVKTLVEGNPNDTCCYEVTTARSKRDFEFKGGENDIMGLVMFEIQGADDFLQLAMVCVFSFRHYTFIDSYLSISFPPFFTEN